MRSLSVEVRDVWHQVFDRPYRNIFRKLDFGHYNFRSQLCLSALIELRKDLAAPSLMYESFFELHRLAEYLCSFAEAVVNLTARLEAKAAGAEYSEAEYRAALSKLDDKRQLLVAAQQRYNRFVREQTAG